MMFTNTPKMLRILRGGIGSRYGGALDIRIVFVVTDLAAYLRLEGGSAVKWYSYVNFGSWM
jgi:hypothetical protein